MAGDQCERLLPRPSAKYVSENSRHVSINTKGVHSLSDKLLDCMKNNAYDTAKWKKHGLNPKVADEKAVEWIFVADLLNFSFWPDESRDKFRIQYAGSEHTGYWSLCAVINRALDQGVALTNAEYYAGVNLNTVEILFRGVSDDVQMPLLEERTRILNETGKILIEKFDGAFVNCVKKANGSAVKLLKLIVDNFPSFRDEATFKRQKVSLYKRAQILVADLWGCFEGQGLGAFSDIDEMTMFADYRIPQALVYFGVLEYSQELMEKLKKGERLEQGGEEEVEIRANSIWAVELVAERLRHLVAGTELENQSMNCVLLDFYLWDYRRAHAQDMEHIPFHKTRCIYY